jgi:hypothetical protein
MNPGDTGALLTFSDSLSCPLRFGVGSGLPSSASEVESADVRGNWPLAPTVQ